MFKLSKDPHFKLIEKFESAKNRNVIPRNLEQQFWYHVLLDDTIGIVAGGGPGGTGKTLLAVQAGYELFKKDQFDQILVFRPHNEVGEPIGFLPGTVDQKNEPWKIPIIRSLGKILPIQGGIHSNDAVRINGVLVSRAVENLLDEGFVQILGTNFVQGDTFERTFIIVDEAQNIQPEDILMLLTRIGEGSKCVITGDMGQVHNPKIKQLVSGLVDTIEYMTGTEEFCYVALTRSERSALVRKVIERFPR